MPSWFFAQLYPVVGHRESDEFNEARRSLFRDLSGEVLEIGAGAGFNLPHYPTGVRLTATDYSPHMLKKLRKPAAAAQIPVEVRQADVQQLPFDTNSFDHAIATLVFCSVPDPAAGYREIARVVRPGGTVGFLEHVAADTPRIRRLQNWITPVWKRFGDGCELNRDTVGALEASGLTIEAVDEVGGIPRLFPSRLIRTRVPS